MIQGKTQRLVPFLELVTPEAQRRIEGIALKTSALPFRKISVADWQRRNCRGRPAAKGAVTLRQFTADDAKGPAIKIHLMHDENQEVFLRCPSKKRHTRSEEHTSELQS